MTIFPALYISYLWLIYFVTESLYLLISLTYFFLVYILIVNIITVLNNSVIWVPLLALPPPASNRRHWFIADFPPPTAHSHSPWPGSLQKLQDAPQSDPSDTSQHKRTGMCDLCKFIILSGLRVWEEGGGAKTSHCPGTQSPRCRASSHLIASPLLWVSRLPLHSN